MIHIRIPNNKPTSAAHLGETLRIVVTWANLHTSQVRVVLDPNTDQLVAHRKVQTTHGHVWEPLDVQFSSSSPRHDGVPIGATALSVVERDLPSDGDLFVMAAQRARVVLHDGKEIVLQYEAQRERGAWTVVGGATFPTLGEALAKAGYKLYLLDGTIAWCAVPYLMSEEVAYRRPPRPRVGRASGKVIAPVDPA